jgi:hypothetical protein
MNITIPASFDLTAHGLTVTEVHHKRQHLAVLHSLTLFVAAARSTPLDPSVDPQHRAHGKFSLDRSIRDYCERVWKLRPAPVAR